MDIEKLSINQVRSLGLSSFGHLGIVFDDFLERYAVKTYEEFIARLYRDLDAIFVDIQANRELRYKDSEDRTTIEIVSQLSRMGYTASHDRKNGGHVDITAQLKKFVWWGEAKKHTSYNHLLEGFKQLSTRYTTGGVGRSNGGLLIYVRNKNTKLVMAKWRQHLSEEKLSDYSSVECSQLPPSFFSEHTHEVSGEKFRVRHMPIMLYFDPQDKSGLRRKNS